MYIIVLFCVLPAWSLKSGIYTGVELAQVKYFPDYLSYGKICVVSTNVLQYQLCTLAVKQILEALVCISLRAGVVSHFSVC